MSDSGTRAQIDRFPAIWSTLVDDNQGAHVNQATSTALVGRVSSGPHLLDLVAASDEIDMLRRNALEHESKRMSANTRRAYSSDWNAFAAWCERHGFDSLPAQPETVRLYVTDLSMQVRDDGEHRFKVSSIERALSAISTRHRETGNGRHLSHHELVANVMAGIRRGRMESRDPKRPLMLNDVIATIKGMDHARWPTGVAAARDTFIVLFGFSTAMRRSEVASLLVGQIVYEPLDGIHIRLGVTKTDQEGRGAVIAVPYGSNPVTCVPCALHRWTKLLAAQSRAEALELVMATGSPETWRHVCRGAVTRLDATTRLVRSVAKNGAIGQSVTGSALNEVVKRRIAAVGYDPSPYGFHSLRSGFVTQARRNGADSRSVRKQTRHASDAMVDVYDLEFLPLRDNAVNILGM
jgi:site-specific recombinase XerD